MAKYLNMAAKQVIIRYATVGLICIVHTFADAQALIDPTRPPSAVATEDTAMGQISTTGPVVQSVLISSRRVEAIISGQTVKVGDKVGDAKVVKITENEVVLRNGKDSQELKLFPNIEKRWNPTRLGTKADNRRQ